jgi:predicted DNA-binding transcriptional regulator YafY
MAGNIHALIRYRTIDLCLQRTHQKWTWQKLSKACGKELRYMVGEEMDDPSRRTIHLDIHHMRDGILGHQAPIVWDRKRKTYRYADPDFSIFNLPLRKEDKEELEHALIILRQFSGFRHVEGIENIIARLDDSVHKNQLQQEAIIQFDHPVNAPGQQWLDRLYRHVFQKEVLHITYHPYDFEEPYTHPFSPYLLKEYNKRWFLVAFNHKRERIETLALDRIQQVEASDMAFYRSPAFDEQQYFRDIIGLTIPDEGKVEEVLIRLSPGQAPYLATKPLHSTQELLENSEDGWLFRFRLIPNYELESQLLALGERVEVLAPASLRAHIKKRIEQTKELYKDLK